MAKASDHELIQQAREGNADAFGVLVRRHQKRIFRLAVHMLRDTTEAEVTDYSQPIDYNPCLESYNFV